MANTYYLPIESVNLAHYFNSAIISPANYIENRNRDIQNTFDNYLLLSSDKFILEADCSLEIVFNEQEEKPYQITEKFYLFDMPLPVSRVKGIYFQDETQKISTVFNITSGAAFLPLNLIYVDSNTPTLSIQKLNDFEPTPTYKNWQTDLIQFDKILGGISLFPISKKQTENYPLNYFGILAHLNFKIKQELEQQKISPSTDYSWALESNGQFKTLHNIIFSKVDDLLVQQVAQKDNVKIEMRNGLYLLNSIPPKTNTYLASILATYGQDKRKKIDDFIADFYSDKFELNRKEGIAFIFGINNGYTSFRNKYKATSFEVNVKFKLDSLLDYYSIESVYQFVFNKKAENTQFVYIDKWCPRYESKSKFEKSAYKILDKDIYLDQDENQSILDGISENVINLLRNWLPKFQPTDRHSIKREIESSLRQEIESFSAAIIKNYELLIKDKNVQIASLEEQVRIWELKKKDMKSSPKSHQSKVAESTPPYRKVKSSSSPQKNIGLFAKDSSDLSEEEMRADELFNWGIGQLKELAKKYSIKGISKYSGKNKSELINRILKVEFSNL